MESLEKKDYKLGAYTGHWGEGTAKNITFIVTEDCQLRCKYCYLHGKIMRIK